MPYAVTANITGEPARIQQRNGQTLFYNRSEAEQFQRDLRQGGFDRVDIIEMAEPKPAETITAPASTPDRIGLGAPRSTEEREAVLASIASQRTEQPITPKQALQLANLEKAIKERPQIAGIRESVREQILYPERFAKRTPPEVFAQRRAIETQAQRQAERAAQQVTAGGIITEFRKLPSEYQTPESLKSIAEASRQRQEIQKNLNRELGYGRGYGRRLSVREMDRDINIRSDISMVGDQRILDSSQKVLGVQRTQAQRVAEQAKLYGKGLKEIFVDFPISVGKGTLKLIYAPNIKGFAQKPLIDIGQQKLLKTEKPLILDPDVQSALFIGGVALSPPLIQKAAFATFIGIEALSKKPIAEKVGVITGAFALGALPKVKALPEQFKNIAERRAAVQEIIRQTEPPAKGLKAQKVIVPPIKPAQKITGIEIMTKEGIKLKDISKPILADKARVGADFKGILFEKEPPRPDFKGIQFAEAKIEPEVLTKKGNIIFKELGIEEAGILKAESKPKKAIKAFAFGNIFAGEFGKRTEITYVPRSSESLIRELERTAVRQRYGTIQTIDLSRPITISRIKGRASPEQYALQLAEEGKIKYYPFVATIRGKPFKDLGIYFPKEKIIGISSKFLSGSPLRERTISHELLHYKTPKSIYKLEEFIEAKTGKEIPYGLQPTEMIAFGGEALLGKYGFRVSQPPPTKLILGEGVLRKEGALKFVYPRKFVKEASIGKNIPKFFASGGDILKHGLKAYEVFTSRIGRTQYVGLLPRNIFTRQAIFLEKSPATKGMWKARFVSRGDRLVGKATYPYIPFDIKFERPKIIIKDYEKPLKLEVGRKEADVGTAIFSGKAFTKRGTYRIIGKEKKFVKGRDIEQFFKGEAVAGITQKSFAGKELRTRTELGLSEEGKLLKKSKTQEIPAEVELVYQPKHKADIMRYIDEQGAEGINRVRESVRRADVLTSRTIRGTAGYTYGARISGYKPLKSLAVGTKNIYSKIKGMGTRGQAPPIFMQGLAIPIQLEKPIRVQAQKPRLKFGVLPKEPSINIKQLELALKGMPKKRIYPIAYQRARQQNLFRQPSREITRAFIKPYSKSFIEIKAYPKIRQPTKEITRTYIRPQIRARERTFGRERAREITRAIVQTKTQAKAIERALQRTRTRIPTQLRIRTPPPPPSTKIPPPFLFRQPKGFGKPKKKERGYSYFYRQFKVRELSLGKPIKLRWKI